MIAGCCSKYAELVLIAYDDDEFQSEWRCMAVQVRNFTGKVVGALGISSATFPACLGRAALQATRRA
jgi:DNA-binding IclR family transcriptional regulator